MHVRDEPQRRDVLDRLVRRPVLAEEHRVVREHVHDLQATVLRCLGVDHLKLTYKYQGRHFRLTDVHGEVIQELLA